jgi:hypothetical protein
LRGIFTKKIFCKGHGIPQELFPGGHKTAKMKLKALKMPKITTLF